MVAWIGTVASHVLLVVWAELDTDGSGIISLQELDKDIYDPMATSAAFHRVIFSRGRFVGDKAAKVFHEVDIFV